MLVPEIHRFAEHERTSPDDALDTMPIARIDRVG